MTTTSKSPLQKQVNAFAETYSPQVIRIRVSESPDHSGDDALHFRVLLEDAPVDGAMTMDLTKIGNKIRTDIRTALIKQFSLQDTEIPVVIRFRCLSEQKALNSPEWN